MRYKWLLIKAGLVLLILAGIIVVISLSQNNQPKQTRQTDLTASGPVCVLPEPDRTGTTPLETTLNQRRSVRNYSEAPLDLKEISQLLWAAQGISEPLHGLRTAPSAGALYPLEILLVAGTVTDLPAGVYRYVPEEHHLEQVIEGDQREALFSVSLNQEAIRVAPATLVIAAVPARTTATYGARGVRYVHMEVGHAGQNISLQAAALNLGTVVIGAFHDKGVSATIGLSQEEEPCYIMPVGRIS